MKDGRAASRQTDYDCDPTTNRNFPRYMRISQWQISLVVRQAVALDKMVKVKQSRYRPGVAQKVTGS